jgi:UDP-2,3-diacylglucosamine pyrophosphatase LpxH
MNRRKLIQSIAVGSVGLFHPNSADASVKQQVYQENNFNNKGSFSIDGNKVKFFNTKIEKPFNMLMLADTHLFRDDERGKPFQQYSSRMAKAYNQTTHFQTGEITNPEQCFQKTLKIAKNNDAAFVALIGDIFSFPSEAAIEWVSNELTNNGLPYIYTAGNHDWHYEGMDGTSQFLRSTWIKNRLQPMYQGENPLMSVRENYGVRFVTIDNSNYEILPEQHDFILKEINTGKPIILMLHIPLYAPERSLGFGCGHPAWSEKTDKNFQLEKRKPWSAAGHTITTMSFHRTVFNAPNILGILAGHIHQQSLDVVNGIPQIVTSANAMGGHLQVEFHQEIKI